MSAAVEKIDQVIALIDTPEKWCKGELMSRDGERCIRGALITIADTRQLEWAIVMAIKEGGF